MSDDRKKPLWPWIMAMLIGLALLYVASFGPACALVEHDVLPNSCLRSAALRPCFWIAVSGPEPIQNLSSEWIRFCGGEWAFVEAIAIDEFGTP